MTGVLEPAFRYVFELADGETVICDPRHTKRTADRRGDQSPVQTVWEVEIRGVIRRLWPNDIIRWTMEPV